MNTGLKTITVLIATCFLYATAYAEMPRTKSPKNADVYIISPASGATVSKKFVIKFGLRGMGVAPAGTAKAKTGHHHLIVDGKLPNFKMPMGKSVKHFGGGQTEVELTLAKGEHTLQLIMGDKSHVPHNPPVVSKVIKVTVR